MSASISSSGGTLNLAKNPRITSRNRFGAPPRSAAMTLAGTPIVVEGKVPPRAQQLNLRIENLTAAEAATLRTILDTAGTVTVDTGTGSTYTCAWGPSENQKLEELIGSYPDGSIPSVLTPWRAELELYVLGITP